MPGTGYRIPGHQASRRSTEFTYVVALQDLLRRPLRDDEDALTGACADFHAVSHLGRCLGQSIPIRRSETRRVPRRLSPGAPNRASPADVQMRSGVVRSSPGLDAAPARRIAGGAMPLHTLDDATALNATSVDPVDSFAVANGRSSTRFGARRASS